MISRKWKTVLSIVCILALAAGLYVGFQRVSVESENKNIELTMGWDDFQAEALKMDYSRDEAFAKAKGNVNAFIFNELTIDDLLNRSYASEIGGATLRTGLYSGEYQIQDDTAGAVASEDISLDYRYLLFTDDDLVSALLNAFKIKTKVETVRYTLVSGNQTFTLIGYDDPGAELAELGLVFDTEAMQAADNAGFLSIPRFSTWSDYREGDLASLLKPLADIHCGGVMFKDKTILNIASAADADELTKDAADAIRATNAPIIMVEFYNQKGLSDLFGETYNVVRMHTINDTELTSTVTPSVAYDRYMLATTERNIRVLYVKTFPGESFDSMMDYTGTLAEDLTDKGFVLAKAEPTREIPVHNIVLTLIAMGVGAGAIFLGEKLRLTKLAAILSVLMIFGCTALAVLGHYILAAKVVGLLAAMVFPSLGLLSFVGGKRSLPQTLLAFVKITAVTLIGAVYIVGLFPIQSYMNSVTVFSGVKLGMIMPLFLLFVYCLFLKDRCDLASRVKYLTRRTVNYGELLILAILGAALIVLMLRSGNEGMSVSGLEQTFRTALDHLLGVRPRTKEFLIGVPCLVIALYFGYKSYLLPLWLLGGIGQVSILNTFCHFHTPLYISVLRTLNGIWIGMILGIIVIGAVLWVMKKYKKKAEGNVL